MQRYAILGLVVLLGVGFVTWLVITIAAAIVDAVKSSFKVGVDQIKAKRKQRADKEHERGIEAQTKKIEESSRVYCDVKSYPRKSPRFRSVSFSYPFEFFFPRKNCSDDGPDPDTWQTTLDSLPIKAGRPLRPIYNSLSAAAEFPVKDPAIELDLRPLPRLPDIQLPSWSIKIIDRQTGGEIAAQSDILRNAYGPEIKQVNALRRTADELHAMIKKKIEKAREEQELMDLHTTNQKLKAKELKLSVSAEFRACKKQFEERAGRELQPIRDIYKAYLLETREGIEQHFSLGLETIQLPLPPQFPWRVFYDRDERLIQINQRVPFVTDITVKRPGSNRPVAKRDADEFLRRFVPSVSLHIAANVAANDWHDHVDLVAVNCWCRFFEKSTGKLKDAFVFVSEDGEKSHFGNEH